MTLVYGLSADLLVLFHVAFVAFALFGALAVAWRPQLAVLHVPAAIWAVLVEMNAWICPLTPWEQSLRRAAGQAGYAGSFVDHYVLPILYPVHLTPRIQWVLAAVVLLVNVLLYAWVIRRGRDRRRA